MPTDFSATAVTIAGRKRNVWTVSRLNQDVRQLIGKSFGTLWLRGEMSNFSRPASGHYYFSLKDSRAQIRCAMFKNRNIHLNFLPENGLHVLARGRLDLYEVRGEYQFVAEHLEAVGAGTLQRQFEQQFARLKAEGLFDAEHKQPLPEYPQAIGIITSASGAALQDALDVLARRYPVAPVYVYPAPVQGAAAASAIARQITRASRERRCDTLLLVRGGGSMEDLWAFNETAVVHAIARCNIPLISGIGHEIDCTLADLVADQRAPTPSAAAELASPTVAATAAKLHAASDALQRSLSAQLNQRRNGLRALEQRLARHPIDAHLSQKYQRCDALEARLSRALLQSLAQGLGALERIGLRLQAVSPQGPISRRRATLQQATTALHHAVHQQIAARRAQLHKSLHTLHTASPLATLERGYSITWRDTDNTPLTSTAQLQAGELIHTRLHSGVVLSRVAKISESPPVAGGSPDNGSSPPRSAAVDDIRDT